MDLVPLHISSLGALVLRPFHHVAYLLSLSFILAAQLSSSRLSTLVYHKLRILCETYAKTKGSFSTETLHHLATHLHSFLVLQ